MDSLSVFLYNEFYNLNLWNREKRAAMKKRTIVIMMIGLLMGMGLVAGCNKESSDVSTYDIPESQKLVVYTSHKEEVYDPIIKEFEERTGIFVEVKQGGTLELFDEIASGRNDGNCDVMFGGGIENYMAYEAYLDAYRVEEEEAIAERYRCSNHKWTSFSVLPIVFIYNSKLVYPAAAPRTWEEIQLSKWKGEIAFADPAESGSSYTALCTMILAAGGDTDTVISNFATALDGNISTNSGAVLEEVNSGTRLVGITLEETALKKMEQGADLSIIYPAEGTSAVPDGVAIVSNAKHRSNAQKFLDFVVSEDVQKLLVDEMYRKSIRKDNAFISDSLKVIDYDIVWAAKEKDTILQKWDMLQKEEE